MFFRIGLLLWSSFVFSHSYELIDFLVSQRSPVPRSHLEIQIESQGRVDFQRLSCNEWKGLFTNYLLPKKKDNLHILGKGKRTNKVLKYLTKKSKYARKLITRLKESPHRVYIKESSGNNFLNLRVFDQYEHNNAYAVTILDKYSLNIEDERIPLNKLGGESIITWNPSKIQGIKLQAITIAHEMYHAYDATRGMLDYRLVKGLGLESTSVTEYRGVYFENLVRKELGLKMRRKYSEGSRGSLKNLWIDRPCL